MNATSGIRKWSDPRNTDDAIVAALRQTIDGTFGKIVAVAAREWERRSSGFDPSDACVSVRVTGGERRLIAR